MVNKDVSWKEYEGLISEIEKYWLDKNARVTRNAELKDVHTGQSREIDVLIETHVGSSDIKVGIECRKRKCKQDVKWIEELHGKQSSCGLSKVIAVSVAGFTKPVWSTYP